MSTPLRLSSTRHFCPGNLLCVRDSIPTASCATIQPGSLFCGGVDGCFSLRTIRGHLHMCRNIKTLFNFDPPVTDDEVGAASLQFVRKITGFNKPSKANETLSLAAVGDVAAISTRLLRSLETTAPPKNREEEAAKAKARAAERFGI